MSAHTTPVLCSLDLRWTTCSRSQCISATRTLGIHAWLEQATPTGIDWAVSSRRRRDPLGARCSLRWRLRNLIFLTNKQIEMLIFDLFVWWLIHAYQLRPSSAHTEHVASPFDHDSLLRSQSCSTVLPKRTLAAVVFASSVHVSFVCSVWDCRALLSTRTLITDESEAACVKKMMPVEMGRRSTPKTN